VNRRTTNHEFGDFYKNEVKNYPNHDANDWAWQLKAMMSHNIFKPYAGNLETTVAAVKAQVLIVIAKQDGMVNPEPARAFARVLGCNVIELFGDSGHLAPGAEGFLCMPAVRQFLEN
jgi:homoserine O-acetyltransferase